MVIQMNQEHRVFTILPNSFFSDLMNCTAIAAQGTVVMPYISKHYEHHHPHFTFLFSNKLVDALYKNSLAYQKAFNNA